MNNKLNTVTLDAVTLKPVVPSSVITAYPGTEGGHFFAKQAELPGMIVTTRPSGEAYQAEVNDGENTRIRIIPTPEFDADDLLVALGFSRKGSGEDIHYSRLSDKAASLVNAIVVVVDALTE
jgi:hypothetical protein